MAGISEVKELEARKRALVIQSELCREALETELHNLALYGATLRKRVDRLRSVGPWLLMGLPAIAPLLGLFRKHHKPHNSAPPSKTKGVLATALLGFRLYRKYSPMVRSVVSHLVSRQRTRAEERHPAGNV